MAEEKRSTQENEFEESQTNDTEKEEVNSEKHQGEAHKKKEDKSCRKEDKQLEELGQKLIEMNDKYLRLSAEFDNYRKRTLKEKMELTKSAGEQLLSNILPVVDNFERGLAGADISDPFADGMNKIYKQLTAMLTDLGVTPIESVGTEFDPNLHNAVMHVEDENVGENIVVEEFQKGYKYKDSVVRHSMVKVAN